VTAVTVAEVVVLGGAAYALAGLLFGVWFVTTRLGRFDPAARGTSVWFRLLLLPGCVALWPLLAVQWRNRP
jgi:hypothetical protein